MRRPRLAVVPAVCLLLAIVGCSAPPGVEPVPTAVPRETEGSAAPTVVAAPVDPTRPVTAPAAGNARQVCAAATAAGNRHAETFFVELGTMLEATGSADAAASQAARRRADAALDAWAAAMREQSAVATDPQLKATLADIAAELGRLDPDVDSVGQTDLEGLQQRLDQLCGQ